jgi:hypothetical protein
MTSPTMGLFSTAWKMALTALPDRGESFFAEPAMTGVAVKGRRPAHHKLKRLDVDRKRRNAQFLSRQEGGKPPGKDRKALRVLHQLPDAAGLRDRETNMASPAEPG